MPRNGPNPTSWCFTLNNYTAADEATIAAWCSAPQIATYVVYGREVGENRTPHLQGYAEFKGRRTLSSVRSLLGRAHWEPRRGTSEEAATYCKKDGSFFEAGVLSKRGRRKDLEEIREEIKAGASEVSIAENHFSQWVVYRRSFSAYRQLVLGGERPVPRVEVLYGPTGTGKTRYVYHRHTDERIWKWPGDQWFDGYDGQDVALFDDFSGEIGITKFLRVLDRYPERVPVKGAFVFFAPRRIYITSNTHPMDWFPDASRAHIDALLRRLTRVEHVMSSIY